MAAVAKIEEEDKVDILEAKIKDMANKEVEEESNKKWGTSVFRNHVHNNMLKKKVITIEEEEGFPVSPEE